MSDDWDGIAKYRYTDDENDKAIFDATDEIHEDLRELVEQWRKITDANPIDDHEIGYHSATDARADELEELIGDE